LQQVFLMYSSVNPACLDRVQEQNTRKKRAGTRAESIMSWGGA
jgi:hypothetical protein